MSRKSQPASPASKPASSPPTTDPPPVRPPNPEVVAAILADPDVELPPPATTVEAPASETVVVDSTPVETSAEPAVVPPAADVVLTTEDLNALTELLERGTKIADELGGLAPDTGSVNKQPDSDVMAEAERAQLDEIVRESDPPVSEPTTAYYMVTEYCRYVQSGVVSTWHQGMVIDSLNFNIDDVKAQGCPIVPCKKEDADLSPGIGKRFA